MNTPSRRRPTKATQTNVLRTAFRSAPSADTIDFQSFVSNHPNRVSNTFTGWYQVPLFVFTCQLARKLRSPDGTSGRTHRIAFRMGDSDRVFEVDVTPAQILSRDGANQSVHYPGASEERILEVLFRLAARPGHGVSALGMFAAVRFTYAMLHDELARHGHEMSHRQLSLSLQVLNQSRMVIRDPKDKEPIYSGSAIPQIVRDNASDDGREVMLIAEFAAPIATLIGRAAYRQIDYERLMQIGHPVARYLYKRLVHRYTYADMTNTYHFRFSANRDAGMLDSYSSRADKQRPVVKAALDELAGLGAKLPGADRVSPK